MESAAIFKFLEHMNEKAAMPAKKAYNLPFWRGLEISRLALATLTENEFYKNDFDYKKMIEDMGIKIKKFSLFTPKNLKAFKAASLSLWDQGVCLVFPDPKTGEQKRMIAYDDRQSSSDCMQTILHEFGHILMRHTQQSMNGEKEAICFSVLMMLYINMAKRIHIRKKIAMSKKKPFFPQLIRKAMQKKEAV